MHARDTTSWKRRSDTLRNDPGASTLRSNEEEAQLQAWEDEGGKTALSINPVRGLIIDDDIELA